MNDQTEIRKRYTAKRLQKAKDYLGSVCTICSTTDQLEFDHIDPSTKVIEITKAIMVQCWSWTRLITELDKCQLLCNDHHKAKSIAAYPKQPCGTYWKYRKYKCRCNACIEANTIQLRKWKNRTPL